MHRQTSTASSNTKFLSVYQCKRVAVSLRQVIRQSPRSNNNKVANYSNQINLPMRPYNCSHSAVIQLTAGKRKMSQKCIAILLLLLLLSLLLLLVSNVPGQPVARHALVQHW